MTRIDVQKLPCENCIIASSSAARQAKTTAKPRASLDARLAWKLAKNSAPSSVNTIRFFQITAKPIQLAETVGSPNAPAAKSKCVGSTPPLTPKRSTKAKQNQNAKSVSERAAPELLCTRPALRRPSSDARPSAAATVGISISRETQA